MTTLCERGLGVGRARFKVRFDLKAIVLFGTVLALIAVFTAAPNANPILAFVFEEVSPKGH